MIDQHIPVASVHETSTNVLRGVNLWKQDIENKIKMLQQHSLLVSEAIFATTSCAHAYESAAYLMRKKPTPRLWPEESEREQVETMLEQWVAEHDKA